MILLLFRGMLHPVDPEAAPAACTHGAPQHHIPHVPLSAGLQHLVLLERSHLLYRQDRRLLTLQLRVSTWDAMKTHGGSGGIAPLTDYSYSIYGYVESGPGWLSRYSDSLRAGGPEIESMWGRDFPHPSGPAVGPTQSPIQWVPGLSRG